MLHRALVLLFICFLITACGGSGSPENTNTSTNLETGTDISNDEVNTSDLSEEFNNDQTDQTEPETVAHDDSIDASELIVNTTFTGQAVKGVISNAQISVYPIIQINGQYQIDFSTPPLTVRSSANGSYQIKPGKGGNNKYYFLELVSDSSTQMKCDFHSGCFSETSGSMVEFGGLISLPSNFKLSTIAQAKAGKISNIPLSPLTHLATNYARELEGGLSEENIVFAKRQIETIFALTENTIDKPHTDITLISEMDNVKQDELNLGIYSAVFYPYIEMQNWGDHKTLELAEMFAHARDLSAHLIDLSTSNRVDRKLSSFQALAIDQLNNSDTSETLSILTHPQSINGEEGEHAALNVSVNKPESTFYQWYKDGELIIGETSPTLEFVSLIPEDSGIYTVSVSDGTSTLESLSAVVSVNPALQAVEITAHPQPVTAREGESTYLEVNATGSGELQYTWQKGGSVLPNATNNRLVFSPVSLSDGGTYSVTVSNSVNSVQSEFATLTINEAISPITILESPQSQSAIEGNSVSFSVSASGGGFISYQWRKNGSLIAGAYQTEFTIESATVDDAGSYDVLVSNSEGSVLSEPASLEVLPLIEPVTINSHPVDLNILETESASFSVSATGGQPLSYVWYRNGVSISNTNSPTFSVENATLEDSANYSVIVSNDVSTIQSNSATLTVQQAPSSEKPVLLSWVAPTTREDGSTLDINEISGYQLSYKLESSANMTEIEIEDSSINEYMLNLEPGTYVACIATRTNDNLTSALTDTISFQIQ